VTIKGALVYRWARHCYKFFGWKTFNNSGCHKIGVLASEGWWEAWQPSPR